MKALKMMVQTIQVTVVVVEVMMIQARLGHPPQTVRLRIMMTKMMMREPILKVVWEPLQATTLGLKPLRKLLVNLS